VGLCAQTGKVKTSIRMMTPLSKTLLQMKVNLKLEKELREQIELILCQTIGRSLTLQLRWNVISQISLAQLNLKTNW